MHWLTQFTLATSIPSWDLVDGRQDIFWDTNSKLRPRYIPFNYAIAGMIVSNVHSVLGDLRVHLNDVIVHWRVRMVPSNGGWVNWFIDFNTFRWRKAACGRQVKLASGLCVTHWCRNRCKYDQEFIIVRVCKSISIPTIWMGWLR